MTFVSEAATQSNLANAYLTACSVEQNQTQDEDLHWYAVYTRSRHEKIVAEQCQLKGIASYLPVYEMNRRWRNGPHSVTLPLFSGYTFARINLRDRLSVLKIRGVVRLVGFNGLPAAIPDEEFENMRAALSCGVLAKPHPYLAAGRRVRLTSGPLCGLEGIVLQRKGIRRVVISVHLLQRSISLNTEVTGLEPVEWPIVNDTRH